MGLEPIFSRINGGNPTLLDEHAIPGQESEPSFLNTWVDRCLKRSQRRSPTLVEGHVFST